MKMKLFVLICLAFLSCAAAYAQSTAIDVNGNAQHTRVMNTKGLETAPSQILWKSEKLFHYREFDSITTQNGPFRFNLDLPTFQNFSAPIIAGDLLYFRYVATDGYLYAIERATGQKVRLLKFDNNSVSAPAAKDNIVFFGSARGQVHAYDVRTQTEKWTFQDKDRSFAGSPVLDRDLLFFSVYNRGLYAFVADTGEVKWLFKSKPYLFPPAVAGDRVIVLTERGRLIALDRATAATRWDVDVGRDATGPQVLGDQIFLVYDGGEIRSYSAADGSLQWKSKGAPRSGTTLALHNGLAYYGGREHSVFAIDVTTGAEKLSFTTKRECRAPVIAEDLLYVRCRDGRLYALSTATLTEVWRIENGGKLPPPVVFADGVMYSLGPDGYLYAVK